MKYNPDNSEHRRILGRDIVAALESNGFTEATTTALERVFVKVIAERIDVAVYTSIVGDEIREVGTDAIRVTARYHEKTGPKIRTLAGSGRVNRTGQMADIIGRMNERIDDVTKRTLSGEKCRDCGAPLFQPKDAGKKPCCAELCWTKKNADKPVPVKRTQECVIQRHEVQQTVKTTEPVKPSPVHNNSPFARFMKKPADDVQQDDVSITSDQHRLGRW